MVHREPLDVDSAGPDGWWRVRDSNEVHCLVFGEVEIGVREIDTLLIETQYLDTLAFRETVESLQALDFNKFSEVFLPPDSAAKLLPAHWQDAFQNGLVGSSVKASEVNLTFPKRKFPLIVNAPEGCLYAEAETTMVCKWLQGGISNTYHDETMTFLDGTGFYSLVNSNNTPSHTVSDKADIKLLRRTVGDKTREFTGTISFYPETVR